MVNNSLQVRLERSRRHRSWANNNSATKTTTTPVASPKSNAAALYTDTTTSQESSNSKIAPSGVSSRRDRMMALSTKTSLKSKAERAAYKNPSPVAANKSNSGNAGAAAAVVKPRSWQSSVVPPEAIDTQQHNNRADDHPEPAIHTQQQQQHKTNRIATRSPKAHPSPTASSPCESSIYQASAMEDSDGSDEPISTEGPPSPPQNKKNKIPHNRSFQSSDGGSVASSPSSTSFENKSINSNSNSNSNNLQSWQQHSSNASNAAPLTKIHPRGGRVIVSRSPTASIGSSTDSPSSAQQQQQFKNIPKSNNNYSDNNKKDWKNSNQVRVNKVSRSPEVQRTISSARYGSPRNFTGSSSSSSSSSSIKSTPSQGCMYKNLLKPIYKEPVKNSHEREAFGAIIETPQKASVTSLHAMFDSQKTSPLMPMNSTDSRVRHSLPRSVASSPVRTGGVASRYRSVTGRSSMQPSLEENRPNASSETTVDDKSNEHNPKYEQTQQTSPNKAHQYYKAAVRVQVQNDILIKEEQISEKGSTITSRNDHPSVPTVYSEGPRSPQRQSVLSSLNQKYKEEKQVQEIQQHNHTEIKNTKTFVEPKSTIVVEEKSRVLEYYESSGRMDDADEEQQVESKTNKAFVDSSANDSAGVVPSWKERCKPRSIGNDDPEPTNDSNNVDAAGIQAITPKPDKPKAPSPSVSLVSAMYSHIKKPKEEKGRISDSTVDSTGSENSNGQNVTPKPDEPKAPSPSVSLVSAMYSHIKKTKEEKVGISDSTVDSTGSENSNGQNITPKPDEPKAPSPSVSLVSAMYSHTKKTKEEKVSISDSTVDSTGSENSNGQNMSQCKESKYSESAPTPTQIEYNYEENHDIEHEPVPWPSPVPSRPMINQLVPQKSQESNDNIQPSANNKPWEKDTTHSIVQSWQMRSSTKNKDSNPAKSPIGTNEQLKTPEIVQSSDGCASSKKEVECLAPISSRDLSSEDKAGIINEDVAIDERNIPELMTNSNSDYYIEEKKSGDLSINEDIILGEDVDGCPSPEQDCAANTREDETSNHSQKKVPYYDDDSYINQNDSDPRGLGASESFKTTSDRSRTIATATWNSEDMSVYVEDERIISKKEDKILTAQFQQMNLEIDEECTRQEEIDTPAVVNSPAPAGKSLPIINPSPKDNDKYRIGYFGDGAPTSIRGVLRRNNGNIHANDNVPDPDAKTVQIDNNNNNNTSKDQVYDVWASTSASNEERDEAIKFDETDQWLDRDPEIDNDSLGDDASVSSVGLNNHINNDTSEPNTPPPQKAVTDHQVEINAPVDFRNPSAVWSPPVENNNKYKQSFCTPEKQRIEKDSWKQHTNTKQDVFDPFAVDDADEEDRSEADISDNNLFSSDPTDPFAGTEESFSPLEWSTPRGGSSNNVPDIQDIGYYTSPDSRVEI